MFSVQDEFLILFFRVSNAWSEREGSFESSSDDS